ncbi:hypothetical protein OU995_07685 [Roseateles sp. SL47]|uniref:FHA domain-containing protein n=1 Tax=Roseateles sp. SL47 TaxID=2995138 RepID=UPI00226F5D35|nr:FHA domain-containing protein [Roseateles sp. SL47]WAC74577.1 hypothetical protein OU995_07685 [Roseateles sp. SL47]
MQLRVLTGLHRGAVLDLDEEAGSLTLGQSPMADAPMADAGLADLHCRLQLQDRQWSLAPADGQVLDARGQALRGPVVLAQGDCFQLGDVWMAFQAAEDAWMEAPTRTMGKRTGGARGDARGKGGAPGQHASVGKGRKGGGRGLLGSLGLGGEAAAASASAAAQTHGRAPGAATYPRMRASLASGALVVVMLPFAAWFVSSAWGRAEQRAPGLPPAGAPALSALAASTPAGTQGTSSVSAADLAEEFTHGLAERELVDKLDLTLKPDRWEIRGSLDAEEQRRFERLLVRFTEHRKPAFPIDVALVTPAELLPFKVVEIVSGKNAVIVTDGGARLSVGDTVEGYKLATVEPGKAVFSGKRRIEVLL